MTRRPVQTGSGGSRHTSPVTGLWRTQRNRRCAAWADTPSARPMSTHVQPASTAAATAASRSDSTTASRAAAVSILFNAEP
jgi:hypothetical protein